MTQQKNTHDPLNVDEALSSSEAFLLKNKNIILGAVVALVVIVCAYMGYKHFIAEPNELKAQETIFKGQQYFDAGNFEAALNGDSITFKGFAALTKEISGTKAGNLANVYAGICCAQLGKYEEATQYLNNFSAEDQLVAPTVLATMGSCYAQLGQLDKAASTFIKAADKANSVALSPIYLINAGQIFEKLGKNAEAVEAYKLVKSKYARSYQAMDIDKYIERASIK